jgi:RND family efflux transporter MFP subunit
MTTSYLGANGKWLVALLVAGAIGGGYYAMTKAPAASGPIAVKNVTTQPQATAVAVTVVKTEVADFIERVLVTGSLVAREEILVAPEVESLRVLELLVDEGDTVKKGQVLARLVTEGLDAQLAQNAANITRVDASIAQAMSAITSAEARLVEAKNAVERARPLRQSGVVSEATLDTREAAFRAADASLVSARDGLKVAQAERAQFEAARRELTWRRANTEVRAPADGVISRRTGRVGQTASAQQDAMFRIIRDGAVELDAEMPESVLAKVRVDQPALVTVTGLGEIAGKVRLISAEVDRTSRLGRVRIAFANDPRLKLGAFGRGTIETAKSRGLALPVPAVLFADEKSFVQVVKGDKVVSTRVETGITSAGRTEIKSGLAEGDIVIARAGTFLRDGDAVRPVFESSKLSEAK